MPDYPATPQQPDQSGVPRIGRSVQIDRAAELLGCSRRTVYNLINQGWLSTVRTLGRSQRVTLESIDRVIKRGTRTFTGPRMGEPRNFGRVGGV